MTDPKTTRERREARAERLRTWAAGREQKATADLERARTMGAAIPFGQPVLAGHHSQGRDQRYRNRISATYERGFAHADKAASMTSRADTIEAQLAGSIYTDDPDAIDALRARLEVLEAERARVKAYNASCRKGAPDPSLITEQERADLATCARFSTLGKGGAFPGYKLSNLTGNIKRNRDRLAELEARS